MDCGDSEGAAPKDLFTWMAGRYPLQTNFRPSASQALQKAYKRGRLEKRLGGKYRLNSAWEGGATSKRTTRRPQTLAQTAYAMQHPQPQSSPFTHAPLQQHQHPPAAGAQPPYANYPYSYPYGYPGYPPHHPGSHAAQAKSAAQSASAPAPNGVTINSAAKAGEEKDESGDAWEAAQHILQAINFGDLKLATQTQSTAPAAGQTGQSAQGTAGVPPPVIVSGGDDDLSAVLSALVSAAGVTANTEPPRASLTEDERAALQAQLALLAAQLTEIAEGAEEDETSGSTPAQPVQPIQAPQPQLVLAIQPPLVAPPQPSPPTQSTQASQPAPQPPPPISAFAGTHIVLDVNAFPEVFLPSKSRPAPAPADAGASTEPLAPASGHQTEVEKLPDDDSDDDDDMEDVVVPLHPHPPTQDAVRT
ncbi:hypothetical protein C8Q78DRAFT_1069623 [Trametes maxima]|nr:hypothetical protein C8Q78DRAFT_1069623 [Trametes maxima]